MMVLQHILSFDKETLQVFLCSCLYDDIFWQFHLASKQTVISISNKQLEHWCKLLLVGQIKWLNSVLGVLLTWWFHLMTSKAKAQLAPLPWTEILVYWVLSFGSHLYSFYQLHRFSKGKVDMGKYQYVNSVNWELQVCLLKRLFVG